MAIVEVTFWNALPPLEVNPNETSGDPVESVLCCGLEIWLPNSETLSLST